MKKGVIIGIGLSVGVLFLVGCKPSSEKREVGVV